MRRSCRPGFNARNREAGAVRVGVNKEVGVGARWGVWLTAGAVRSFSTTDIDCHSYRDSPYIFVSNKRAHLLVEFARAWKWCDPRARATSTKRCVLLSKTKIYSKLRKMPCSAPSGFAALLCTAMGRVGDGGVFRFPPASRSACATRAPAAGGGSSKSPSVTPHPFGQCVQTSSVSVWVQPRQLPRYVPGGRPSALSGPSSAGLPPPHPASAQRGLVANASSRIERRVSAEGMAFGLSF